MSWAASLPAVVSNSGSKIATKIVPVIITATAIITPSATESPLQPVSGMPT